MLPSSEITSEEVHTLSNFSPIQLVIKDAILNESDLEILLQDVRTIRESSRLSAAKMGARGGTVIGSDILRGDQTCWITPDLCKDLSLTGMKSFVQMMIKFLKPFQQQLGLAADYSVQCAIYVSHQHSTSIKFKQFMMANLILKLKFSTFVTFDSLGMEVDT